MAAGYDNGDIKLFDLRKMALRWENNLNNGVSVLSIDYSMWCVRSVVVVLGVLRSDRLVSMSRWATPAML